MKLYYVVLYRLRQRRKGNAIRLARQITFAILVLTATVAICSAGLGIKLPELIRFIAPSFPSGANSSVSDEKVVAIVTVNADGTVRDVVIKDAKKTPLENTIDKAVRKWIFIPTMKGGKVVPIKISILFSFD